MPLQEKSTIKHRIDTSHIFGHADFLLLNYVLPGWVYIPPSESMDTFLDQLLSPENENNNLSEQYYQISLSSDFMDGVATVDDTYTNTTETTDTTYSTNNITTTINTTTDSTATVTDTTTDMATGTSTGTTTDTATDTTTDTATGTTTTTDTSTQSDSSNFPAYLFFSLDGTSGEGVQGYNQSGMTTTLYTRVSATVNGSTLTVSSNGVPNYTPSIGSLEIVEGWSDEIQEFGDANPNSIGEQDWNFTIPLNPEYLEDPLTRPTGMGAIVSHLMEFHSLIHLLILNMLCD